MSASFTLEQALEWTGGESLGSPSTLTFTGVGIDTRTISSGQLFVAIRGERHDAHDFLQEAIGRECRGLMVENAWLAQQKEIPHWPLIAVDHCTESLGALARGHREQFSGPVVAVTGSNGKTTTKEMIHAILSQRGPCLKNFGNLNNEFGLPLTLLARDHGDWAAVVELGMNHRGEIARLARIAKPSVGLITNIGTAHIGHLGSQEEIAQEKGDLVAALPPEATAVLNADDSLVLEQASRTHASTRTFGLKAPADVKAENIAFNHEGTFCFDLIASEGCCPIRIQGLSDSTVMNALAAAAAALAAGAQLEDISIGLDAFRPVEGRMVCRVLDGGDHVIDDTYNANPQSMREALETLARLKGKGKAIAILGEMGELGESSEEAHFETGRWAAELEIDRLYTLGRHAEQMASGAAQAGMPADCIHVEEVHEEAARNAEKILQGRDWILVKGSRSMAMERIVKTLLVRGRD